MLKKRDFMAIVKYNGVLSDIYLKSFLESQGLIETNLSRGTIKVLTFQGNELDLAFKKAGLESEIVSQYLTVMNIGLAPEIQKSPNKVTSISSVRKR